MGNRLYGGRDGNVIGATDQCEPEPARLCTSMQIFKFVIDVAERSRILAPNAAHQDSKIDIRVSALSAERKQWSVHFRSSIAKESPACSLRGNLIEVELVNQNLLLVRARFGHLIPGLIGDEG